MDPQDTGKLAAVSSVMLEEGYLLCALSTFMYMSIVVVKRGEE